MQIFPLFAQSDTRVRFGTVKMRDFIFCRSIFQKNVIAWRSFQKNSCDISKYDKCHFKPQISSIFHCYRVSKGQMAHVLGAKYLCNCM